MSSVLKGVLSIYLKLIYTKINYLILIYLNILSHDSGLSSLFCLFGVNPKSTLVGGSNEWNILIQGYFNSYLHSFNLLFILINNKLRIYKNANF